MVRAVLALAVVLAWPLEAPAESALSRLRATHPSVARVIAKRVAQKKPKMKLTAAEGEAAAAALLRLLPDSKPLAALTKTMPRSCVELARAVDERDLPASDATAIADYLNQLVRAADFARLSNFDNNHSHVTGRHWHEIDYSGESMTWQGQKKYWGKRGVGDFRSVEHIDAYMRGAAKMRHFARVYRPRRSLDTFVYRPPQPSKR